MGKFINTSRKDTVDSLVNGIKHRLDSPFYIFNDKKPTVVTFYNVNDTKSTLDEGSKQVADIKDYDSPLKYNKIEGVFIYGLERIQAELEVGDFGIEANDIEGECILPPNSFRPYVDSYFTIDHVTRGTYWFRIIKVTSDTLENGSNFWKLEYTLDDIGDDRALKVEKEFRFIADNVGSNYKSVIEDKEYEFVERMEEVTNSLRKTYMSLFFADSLQTFVYYYQDANFYDPETIEFMIRNRVMYGDEYIFVDQAVALPDTFSIQYDKSIYRYIEKCKKDFVFKRYYGLMNDDPMSLLATRLEEYYIVTPDPHLKLVAEPLETFSNEFTAAILNNQKQDGEKEFYNIIANYFNDQKPITGKMIDSLENITLMNNTELYHALPIIIFILDKELEKLMLNKRMHKSLM
nr:MAG TPA: hypothetical protein [Caudoviricetes sp.]